MKQTKILNSFFLENPKHLSFWKNTPLMEHKYLNNIIPHTYNNLLRAIPEFLSGLNDLDEDFIHNTVSPYLYKRLSKEINYLHSQRYSENKNNMDNVGNFAQLDINFNEIDFLGKDRLQLSIFPYTVFMATLHQRINQHPLKNITMLTRNRYLLRN